MGDGVVFQNGTLGGLAFAAGLWAAAFAGSAAAQPGPTMALGAAALAPEGYVSFCQRQPWDCGASPQEVLARADQAAAERAALFAAASAVTLGTLPGGMPGSVLTPAIATAQAGARQAAAASAPMQATVERAAVVTRVDFVVRPAPPALSDGTDPDAEPVLQEALQTGPVRMSHGLWATLNRVNDDVNGAIREATDMTTYGKDDVWATPIEDGVRSGDCEDFVLEKERALLAAGLPREDLNIAVVTTPWGESHAVLLVNTTEGELVLDNLSRWIQPWEKTSYRWRQRQVGGEAFKWVMVVDPSRPRPQPLGGAVVGSIR
jgi:predicted transglutaminase-like cysteine proteinase